jgi:cytoskeletal protein CcmA (bactofilin family)
VFSKKEPSPKSDDRSVTPRSAGLSMLAKGCHFQGKVYLHGDARIGGDIEGTIVSSAMLTIEQSAVIKGDINGTNVLLNGRVEGNIVANEVLRLSPSSIVTGDLCAKRLIVEDGARIDGHVSRMGEKESAKVKTLPIIGKVDPAKQKLAV